MTAREVEQKLKKVHWLKKEIKAKERQLIEIETAATHITAVLSQTKSQPTEMMSKPESYAIRSYELKVKIKEDTDDLMKQTREAYRMIAILEDPAQRAILTDYHLNDIPIRKLEETYHYSDRQIYNIRHAGYQNISDNFRL